MTGVELSAEILRQAAALMRERAEAATPGPWAEAATPGPWAEVVLGSEGYDVRGPEVTPPGARMPRRARVARCGYMDWDTDKGNAAHIASWHPLLALAVADWLEHAAARAESKVQHGGKPDPVWSHERDALVVARAYLGSDR